MKDFLNGALLVEWLYETAPQTVAEHRTRLGSFDRAMHRWQHQGSSPTVDSVDKYMTQMALPLSWVPDEIYVDDPRCGAHGLFTPATDEATYAQIEAEIAAGESPTKVTRRHGVSVDALYKRRSRARARGAAV